MGADWNFTSKSVTAMASIGVAEARGIDTEDSTTLTPKNTMVLLVKPASIIIVNY